MGQRITRLFCIILGGIIGYYVGYWYSFYFIVDTSVPYQIRYFNLLGIIAAFAMLGYLLAPIFHKELVSFNNWIEISIHRISPQIIVAGSLGIIVGLILANLILLPLMLFSNQRESFLPLIILGNLVFAYLGLIVSIKLNLFPKLNKIDDKSYTQSKILDTSVIIDGRILDILKTGFVDGEFIIPNFVFQELRHIADSPDILRRNRGRRGLDILKSLQEEIKDRIRVYEVDWDRRMEVDDQLIKLAKQLNAVIITNDYNLNKQATTIGIKVLNINELTNAVKTVALPGEEMEINLIKEGKELDQAIGYLPDGTMVVVENGRSFIGETIEVMVTNMLQTPAGRVIFARPKVEGFVRS